MKAEVNGKTYCVETLIADNERLRKEIIESAKTNRLVLDSVRTEIADLDYLNIEDGSDGYDKYIDQYDVLEIIDKYRNEVNE